MDGEAGLSFCTQGESMALSQPLVEMGQKVGVLLQGVGMETKKGDIVLVPGPLLCLVPWDGCLMSLATTPFQHLPHCLQPSLGTIIPPISPGCPGDARTGHSLELTHVLTPSQDPGGEPQAGSALQEAREAEELHQ